MSNKINCKCCGFESDASEELLSRVQGKLVCSACEDELRDERPFDECDDGGGMPLSPCNALSLWYGGYMSKTDNPLFDVYDREGMQRLYMGMSRTTFGYNWADSYGFITDDQIKRYGWVIVPAAIEVE